MIVKYTIPFLVLMLLIPAGIGNTFAQNTGTYSATEVSDAIKQITPYVVLDADRLVRFTVDKEDIPLDPRLIVIAYDYIQIQNSYISQIQANPDEKPTIDEETSEKFSEFFDDIYKKKIKSQEAINRISGFEWILPEAFAWSDVCGGSPDNPHPEPPVVRYITGSINAVDHLLARGYHQVAVYASEHYGDDYAITTSAYGCGNGEMRTQGIVTGSNTYNHQSPEPNPEVLSYASPVWWWSLYTAAWHYEN